MQSSNPSVPDSQPRSRNLLKTWKRLVEIGKEPVGSWDKLLAGIVRPYSRLVQQLRWLAAGSPGGESSLQKTDMVKLPSHTP